MSAPQPSRVELKLLSELGTTVLDTLQGERTEDVVLNQDGRAWVKRSGEPFAFLCMISPERAMGAICTAASMAGVQCNHDHPILETDVLGYRLEAIVKPVTSWPVMAIRTRPKQVFRLADYRASGILRKGVAARVPKPAWRPPAGSDHMETIIAAAVDRQNILIVGPPGTGKTRLADAVLAEIAERCPADRTALIEDVPELQCTAPNSVSLRSVESAEHPVTMLRCLKAALRLRVSRIIIGEVRGEEAHALLKAWQTGHTGLCTVHANDCRSGLLRLESLVAEAPEARGVPQQSLIAEAVQVVVFIDHADDVPAGRMVREVALVRGWNQEERRYEMEYV